MDDYSRVTHLPVAVWSTGMVSSFGDGDTTPPAASETRSTARRAVPAPQTERVRHTHTELLRTRGTASFTRFGVYTRHTQNPPPCVSDKDPNE
mmetsp:Transcript_3066/g.3388  ORF Transcript_3066/g.3388 Transcript_3066/m.3388 type:complete len:93 (+) Transcript_3066:134-412(+)